MSISRYIADLEAKFDQERRDELSQDVRELLVEERASVAFAQRLLATIGGHLEFVLRHGTRVAGEVLEVAQTWVLLRTLHDETLIPLGAIVQVSSLGRAVPDTQQVRVRLGMTSILRRMAQANVFVTIVHDGGEAAGQLYAVYSDHIDLILNDRGYGDVRDTADVSVVTIPLRNVKKISATSSHW